MANIYELQRYGKWIFLITAASVVAFFLYVSNNLVKDLAARERERMEIWADATKEIVNQLELDTHVDDAPDTHVDDAPDALSQSDSDAAAQENKSLSDSDSDAAQDNKSLSDSDSDDIAASNMSQMPVVDIDFLLRIIESNTTIPVLLTDDCGNIINYRNFELPEPIDSMAPMALSATNQKYLEKKLHDLSGNAEHVIHIKIAPDVEQLLYYEDSTLLKRLSYYPYVQLLVMIVFLFVVYFAVLSTKKAEQNKVWVGLSKETAHQLGTPISSLMAWMELLPDMGVDDDTCAEMNKDVKRLSTIASRFSKIGSKPQMELDDAGQIVRHAAEYMATRISPRIDFKTYFSDEKMPVQVSAPLFEWVMENLIKNAVDAMEGHGSLTVTTGKEQTFAYIEVTDTGKGIARKNFNNVFNPGFTTKKRGWGLGLTLAKRIIEQYHRGRIYVKTSAPGVGTTFRIELPLT